MHSAATTKCSKNQNFKRVFPKIFLHLKLCSEASISYHSLLQKIIIIKTQAYKDKKTHTHKLHTIAAG